MDAYFESFKEKMQNRFRIPQQLVDEYEEEICFLVDCNKVYIQVVRPRIAWVKPLAYEVNIDETRDIIEALINEPINPKAPYFGTYVEAKERITTEIKIAQILKRGRMTVEKFEKEFERLAGTTLMLTKGKGEDEEGDEEEIKEKEVE